MDVNELRRIRRNLDRFLGQFADCFRTVPSRRHLRTYVRGQVSHLDRKSIEPMALAAKVPPRSLQEFIGLHRWDRDAMRDRVQEIVVRDHADAHAVAVVDETGCPKKGTHTVGVARQYCGATGKIDNCVMTVHLGYAAKGFHTLIDSDLYLPRDTWCADPGRRRAAGIPDTVTFRPKWRIALTLDGCLAPATGATSWQWSAYKRGMQSHALKGRALGSPPTSHRGRPARETGPEIAA